MINTILACAWLLASGSGMPSAETFDTADTAAEEEAIVYDNTTSPAGNAIEDILPTTKIGNQVTLEGDARKITRIEFLLGGQDLSTEGNTRNVRYKVRLTLYDPNKLHRPDSPGRIIWATLRQTVTVKEGEQVLVAFDLPEVEVPDEIVWALAFSGFEQYVIAPSIPFYGPPTVGETWDEGYWYYNVLARKWLVQDIGGVSHYARIYAVEGEAEDDGEQDPPSIRSRR